MSEVNKGPVGLGIIGSGLAVKLLHWPALKRMAEQYRVVASCDIDLKMAQEVAKMAGKDLASPDCQVTTDYRELLANEAVEAVLVSLPIHLNAQIMIEAARAGKHILCEKPLAANLPQAQELVASLRPFKNLVIEIAENFHYREDLAKAREWAEAGRIGEVFLVQMSAPFYSDTSSGFAGTPWRWDNQYRGGIIADAGVHHAAALRELGGEVEQLQAFSKAVHPQMRGMDTLVLNLRYRSGALGSLVFAGAAKSPQGSFVQATVYGTEGALQVGEGRVALFEGANDKASKKDEFAVADFDGGYWAEFKNFYEAIRQGAPVVSTVEQALADWTIVMRALDSAESRSVILL